MILPYPSRKPQFFTGDSFCNVLLPHHSLHLADIAQVIVCFLCLDHAFKDWNGLETNLKVCRYIAKSRGGLDNLGFEGFCASVITWCETRWANHASLHRLPDPPDLTGAHLYPSSPFPPILCTSISTLPPGLQSLALTGHVSLALVSHLTTIQTWSIQCIQQITSPDHPSSWSLHTWYNVEMQHIQRLAKFLGNPYLKPLERLLAIGCMAFVLASGCINDSRVDAWRLPRGIEEHLAPEPEPDADPANTPPHDFVSLKFESLYNRVSLVPESADTLLWIAFAVAGTEDGPLPLRNQTLLLDTLLRDRSDLLAPQIQTDMESEEGKKSGESGWLPVSARLRSFFWREDLDRRWETCWRDALKRVNLGD